MNIALFGASGMIGRRILDEALERGHRVRAIVGDPSRLEDRLEGMTVEVGDILDPASVAEAASGCDAVVSAFGVRADQGPGAIARAARTLIAGLKDGGPRRLIFVGGAGGLEVAPGTWVLDVPHFPPALRPIALDHAHALEVFRKEGEDLEWTYFSPAAMIHPRRADRPVPPRRRPPRRRRPGRQPDLRRGLRRRPPRRIGDPPARP